jgi:hypothetical protein
MSEVQKSSDSEWYPPLSEPCEFFFRDVHSLVFVKLITNSVAFVYTGGH